MTAGCVHLLLHAINSQLATLVSLILSRGVGRGVSRASGNPLQFSVYNKVSAVAAN